MSREFNLTLDVPENINELTYQQLVDYAGSRFKPAGSFKPIQVLNILNNIFMRIGLKLDNEQLLFLMDDSKRVLCEASAGSGKTTVSQLKMIKMKMLYGIDGTDILAIAYNDHAAIDMQKRHTSLVEQIMSQRISGVKMNDRIVCRTFHSNALAWVTEYANKCGITNKETIVISDANTEKFMTKALESAIKTHNKKTGENLSIEQIDPNTIPALISYLSYIEEVMMTVAESVYLPKFTEINLPQSMVEDVIIRFNKLCEFNSMFTFSNILVKFYDLLRLNEGIRTRIQGAYKALLVDEYQDMTPLMNAIIALMINDDTIFNAIGDGDQSIYSFKGTDSLNCLKFRQYFPDGVVVSMGANRRCRKNIVDVARNILSINTLRYPKEIYSLKDGGSVVTRPYDSSADECSFLISELKNIPIDKLYDVCIAYRNRESSLLLSKRLLDARIPFNVKSGYEPYKDILSASLYEIYAMLKQPLSVAYHKNTLYKLIPASKSQVNKVVSEGSGGETMKHYLDYKWESLGNLSYAVRKALTTVKECEDAVRSDAPMSNYFNKIWNLFKLYYWNWVSKQVKFPADLEESVVQDYSTSRGYKQFCKDYNEQIEIRDRFSRGGIGVTLTTFHGLKGLEFSSVYLIDLDDRIFPNYEKIEKECSSNPDAELEEKEECVRLFYVSCTRPKDKLTVLYSASNPSIYIDLLRPRELKKVAPVEVEEKVVDIDDSDIMSSLFDEAVDEDVYDEQDDINVFGDEEDISLDDVELDEFQVPSSVTDVSDGNESDDEITVTEDRVPVADHRMYMYHELSGSYYVIEAGEPMYSGSSIDFESSDEITEEQYNAGVMRQEVEDSKYKALTISEEVSESAIPDSDRKEMQKTNRLESALGIFDFLSS